jgi:hypothetical protein
MTTTNTSKKFNLSAIMKSAWNFVRTLALTISQALKKAWAEAKASLAEVTIVPGAMAVIAEEPVEPAFEIECGSKQKYPATYDQYQYLLSFDNVEMNCNVSSFTSRISRIDASVAIDEAKSGRKVIINR